MQSDPSNRRRIPTKDENPNGLYRKYLIKKYSGERRNPNSFFGEMRPVYKTVPANEEYFVLRLDNEQKDPNHKAACIKAVLTYAEAIRPFIPKLAADLISRYASSLPPSGEEETAVGFGFSGSSVLHDLLQVANFKNEDGMPVIKYVDKPNGGSVAYVRHDAMVKKLNDLIQQYKSRPPAPPSI